MKIENFKECESSFEGIHRRYILNEKGLDILSELENQPFKREERLIFYQEIRELAKKNFPNAKESERNLCLVKYANPNPGKIILHFQTKPDMDLFTSELEK